MKEIVFDRQNNISVLKLSDCFDLTLELYKRNFKFFIMVSILFIVLGRMPITAYMHLSGMDRLTASQTVGTAPDMELFGRMIAVLMVSGLANLILLPIQMGSVAVGASECLFGRPPLAKAAFKAASRKWFALVGTYICVGMLAMLIIFTLAIVISILFAILLSGIALGAGANGGPVSVALTIIVAVIIIAAGLAVMCIFGAFTTQIVMFEGNSGTNAISRNIELVKPKLLASTWGVFVAYLISQTFEIAMQTPIQFLAPALSRWLHLGDNFQTSFIIAIDGLAGLFVQPFIMVFLTVYYFERRCRFEGFDLYQKLMMGSQGQV